MARRLLIHFRTAPFAVRSLALCVLLPSVTHASHFGREVLQGIDVSYGLSATPPGNISRKVFVNQVMPNHRTRLKFAGSLDASSSTQPISATYWFIWSDPSNRRSLSSTPTTISLPAGGQQTVITQIDLSFTPVQVGVHLQNLGPSAPLQITGVLTHQTIPIPEPSAFALAATGLIVALATGGRLKIRPASFRVNTLASS